LSGGYLKEIRAFGLDAPGMAVACNSASDRERKR
jgi:hypothetical protein